MSAALGALSEEQAGAGPGLMQALRQGGAIGMAASAILAAFFPPRHTPPVAGQPTAAPAREQRSTQ